MPQPYEPVIVLPGGEKRHGNRRARRRFLRCGARSGTKAAKFGSEDKTMPARSKKQQMAAGAALAAKRGERSKTSLKGASRQMVESMSEKQLEEFASTKAQDVAAPRGQNESRGHTQIADFAGNGIEGGAITRQGQRRPEPALLCRNCLREIFHRGGEAVAPMRQV
jgi:hypothetical protein